jgi:hypothetical protein
VCSKITNRMQQCPCNIEEQPVASTVAFRNLSAVIRFNFPSIECDGQSFSSGTAFEMNSFLSFLVVLQLLSIINVHSLRQANAVNKNYGSCSMFRNTPIPKRSIQLSSSADDNTFGPACVIVACVRLVIAAHRRYIMANGARKLI